VGKGFFANFGCTILDSNRVDIGDNVLFAPYVQLYTSTHPVDPAVRRQGLEMAHPIKVGAVVRVDRVKHTAALNNVA